MATVSVTNLRNTRAPNLPLSPAIPDRAYLDQLNNVLRLYFNQIDGVTGGLLGSPSNGSGQQPGGSFLNFPYAAIQRTTDKTFTANTVTQITFDQNDYLNACLNDGTDGIVVETPGIYNYQFSVQWANSDSQEHDAWIWLRKNNVDVVGTGSQFTIPSKHGSVDGHLIAAANFYVDLSAGDYVSMYAAVDNTAVTMEYKAAITSPFAMPAVPSVVATLSFVSSLPT